MAARALSLPIVVIATAVAVAVAVMPHGSASDAPISPALALSAAGEGPLELRTSHEGEPIVSAPALAPGWRAAGEVEITSTGTHAARLTLAKRELADSPGANGGRLSESVRVRITRVRHRAPHRRLRRVAYAGTLASMPSRLALPAISPGRSRTYRLRVKLPDRGVPASPTSGDNALQGSSTSVDFVWLAKPTGPGR